MWNCNDLHNQVTLLLEHYQDLFIAEEDDHRILLSGSMLIYRSACEFILHKQYAVEIVVPKADTALPVAIDKGSVIASSYPHRYADGSLCLETDSYIRYRFIDGIDLVEWMDEFVEPYFFSYEYYTRFGNFPFGERPHGLEGLIHTYQEFWHENDLVVTCGLLKYAAEENYRGHALCPCNSGKKLRQCHGPALFPYMRDKRRLEILRSDFQYLRKVLTEYEQSKPNK